MARQWYDPTDWGSYVESGLENIGAPSWTNDALGYALVPATGGLSLLATDLPGDVVSGKAFDAAKGFVSPGTQQTVNEPWGPQQQYLTDLFSKSQQLYNQGVPLTPDFSQDTLDALAAQKTLATDPALTNLMQTGIEGLSGYENPYLSDFGGYQGLSGGQTAEYQTLGGQRDPTTDAIRGINVMDPTGPQVSSTISGLGGMYQELLGRAGVTPYQEGFQDLIGQSLQSPYAGELAQTARGATDTPYSEQTEQAIGMALRNPALSRFDPVLSQLVGPSTGEELLAGTAQGEFLGGNPYLDATYGRAAEQVGKQFREATMPALGTAFSQAGRYGSDAYGEAVQGAEEALGRELSGLATDIYMPAYESERGRQEAARSRLAGLPTERLGTALGGLGSMGGLYTGGIGQAIGGLQGLTGAAQTGTGQKLSGLGTAGGLRQSGLGMGLGGLGTLAGLQQTGTGQQLSGLGALGGLQMQGLGLQSNIAQSNVANQLAQQGMLSDIYGQDWQRQFQGLGALDQNEQFYNQMGLNALGQQAGFAQQGANTQLGALGMLPGLQGMQYQNVSALRDIGSAQDALAQQQAMDPWNRLQMYGQGVTGQYGGTTTAPGQSPFQQVLDPLSQMAQIATPFVLAK